MVVLAQCLMNLVSYCLCLEHLEGETKDFLLAQYEKVHRVKNKWKCTFKDAILHINGKEYVFEKVVGELERDW
jgi:transcription initiation factor TFIIA large subunit